MRERRGALRSAGRVETDERSAALWRGLMARTIECTSSGRFDPQSLLPAAASSACEAAARPHLFAHGLNHTPNTLQIAFGLLGANSSAKKIPRSGQAPFP